MIEMIQVLVFLILLCINIRFEVVLIDLRVYLFVTIKQEILVPGCD